MALATIHTRTLPVSVSINLQVGLFISAPISLSINIGINSININSVSLSVLLNAVIYLTDNSGLNQSVNLLSNNILKAYAVPKLPFYQLFGDNAIQTTTHLIIKKSDLAGINGNAESILVALILRLNNYSIDKSNLPREKINCFYWKRHFLEGLIRDDFINEIFTLGSDDYDQQINLGKL